MWINFRFCKRIHKKVTQWTAPIEPQHSYVPLSSFQYSQPAPWRVTKNKTHILHSPHIRHKIASLQPRAIVLYRISYNHVPIYRAERNYRIIFCHICASRRTNKRWYLLIGMKMGGDGGFSLHPSQDENERRHIRKKKYLERKKSEAHKKSIKINTYQHKINTIHIQTETF